ncbi:eukaryotic initiation factor 4E domain-containing protein [Ditylenchus destructor]|nr:eukaryotic initiation factor 4E domain-containing protein [Ditylenchus destructor]
MNTSAIASEELAENQQTPKNVRDHLHEESRFWTEPREELNKKQLHTIRHKLDQKWFLWYLSEEKRGLTWNDRLRPVHPVTTIEQFWALYAYVKRPSHLPTTTGYAFFCDGLSPKHNNTEENASEGQLIMSIRNTAKMTKKDVHLQLNDYWKRLIIALAGVQFNDYQDHICGAMVILDHYSNDLSLWVRNASDDIMQELENRFRAIVSLNGEPVTWPVSYVKHPADITPVLQIYGVNQKHFSSDTIFNLVCSFGDCLKILFPVPNNGMCLIQMRNEMDSRNVIDRLNGCPGVGKPLLFMPWRKTAIDEPAVSDIYTLPDGSQSFVCYVDSPLLRFSDPLFANKNKIVGPTHQLHFFNAPQNITTRHLRKMFEDVHIKPKYVQISNKTQRNCSGFVTFNNTEEAVTALMQCNHTKIEVPHVKLPYILKLCFAHDPSPLEQRQR